MRNDFDLETIIIIHCNFCDEPIFPLEDRTVDLDTGNRYCNTYCCDQGRKK